MIKVGRNELCPCNSGIKYKKCCLKGESSSETSLKRSQLKPAQAIMQERLTQQLGKKVDFLPFNSESIKMSEVILEFADDLLQQANTDSARHVAIGIACHAWNLALLDEVEREEKFQEMLHDIGNNDSQSKEDLRSIIDNLIQRKLNQFSHINRYILDYQPSGSGINSRLDIVSTL